MEKLKRYKIILKVAELESASDISKLIEGFIIDELRYAGLKARGDKDTLSKEIRCVLEAYSFDNYGLSSRIKNYIDYALANPFVATMQHYDLNDLHHPSYLSSSQYLFHPLKYSNLYIQFFLYLQVSVSHCASRNPSLQC